MKILAISGSASPKGSNYFLLQALHELVKDEHDLEIYDNLQDFPLFTPERLKAGAPDVVKNFKEKLVKADAVIISTPEYTHNIPAVLKNMIEWCTHSGEFENKRVLPITFTPHEPRGEYAMKSLNFSLTTMNAQVVAELPLYKTDVEIGEAQIKFSDELSDMIREAIRLL